MERLIGCPEFSVGNQPVSNGNGNIAGERRAGGVITSEHRMSGYCREMQSAVRLQIV